MTRFSVGALVAVFVISSLASRPHPVAPARHEVRFPSGALRRTWHVDEIGRRHGEEVRYREDGSVESRAVYDHGSWIEHVDYWFNGAKSREGHAGILFDSWQYWDDEGNELREEEGAVAFPAN